MIFEQRKENKRLNRINEEIQFLLEKHIGNLHKKDILTDPNEFKDVKIDNQVNLLEIMKSWNSKIISEYQIKSKILNFKHTSFLENNYNQFDEVPSEIINFRLIIEKNLIAIKSNRENKYLIPDKKIHLNKLMRNLIILVIFQKNHFQNIKIGGNLKLKK